MWWEGLNVTVSNPSRSLHTLRHKSLRTRKNSSSNLRRRQLTLLGGRAKSHFRTSRARQKITVVWFQLGPTARRWNPSSFSVFLKIRTGVAIGITRLMPILEGTSVKEDIQRLLDEW